MMLDGLQTYKEPSLIHAIEGVSGELELKRIMLVEVGKEVAQEDAEKVPEAFIEEHWDRG